MEVTILNAIDELFEDGHWQVLPKHPTSADYSPFANKKDAKKVRAKKTPIQKGGFKGGKVSGLHERLDSLFQDILEAEKEEHQPTVAVDFDGTLAEDVGHPDIGEPREGAREAMERLHEVGARIIIFTVRGESYEDQIREWLEHHEIPFDYINENPDQPHDASGKIMADVYIDDCAINARRDWDEIVDEVLQVLNIDEIQEDQYKSPTSRHTRKQSPFPSSFGPSKSFGGISTRRNKKRKVQEATTSGEMQPVRFEPEKNFGVLDAGRTADDSATDVGRRGLKTRSYKDRRDLTDLPTTVKFNSMADPDALYMDATYQHVIPGTQTGTPADPHDRPLVTGKVVPNAAHEPFDNAEGEEFDPEFDDVNVELDDETLDVGRPGLVDRKSYRELRRVGYSMEMMDRLDFLIEETLRISEPGEKVASGRFITVDELKAWGSPDPRVRGFMSASHNNYKAIKPYMDKFDSMPDRAAEGYTFIVMVGDEPVYFSDKKSMWDFVGQHMNEIKQIDYMDIPPEVVAPSANFDPLGKRLDARLDAIPNMRPLGVFGPRDDRAPAGGPISNVTVQHPPDRSFDANSPKITTKKIPSELTSVDGFHHKLKQALGQG